MKRIAWFSFIILATLALAFLFWQFRTALVLFILSLAVAATVRPLVDWVSARGLPRGLALLFTYGVCIGSIITLILIISGPLINNLQQVMKDLGSGYEQIQVQWPAGNLLQRSLAQQLPAAADLSKAIAGAQGFSLLQSMLGFTLSSFDLFGQVTIVLALSLYWSADQEHFKRLWLSLLPFDARARAREIWQNIETGFGAYLRSEVIQFMLALILLGAGFQLLGIKYAAALALIGAIAWLIPWVGVVLAVIPGVLVGLSTSPVLGFLAAGLTIGVLSFLEFVVEPRLFNRERFSSLLAVIVMLVLVDEFGLIAVLVAPPMAAAIQIIAGQIIHLTTLSNAVSPVVSVPSAQPVSVLKERLALIQMRSADQNEIAPEMSNLMERLDAIIEQAGMEENRLTNAGAVQKAITEP